MKISVVVTTYNHEKYISKCLESILSQKGDFQLEIVVGDDCSIDGTRAIVQQYQTKNPEMILLLPAEDNQGITKNLKRCLEACSGEYIAVCEGDDYWTDDFKLQKQKNLLESRKDYSMCFSAVMLYLEDQNVFIPHNDQVNLKKDWIITEELIERNYIGNFSCCMYRTDVVRKLSKSLYDIYTVDWMFNMACGQMGKIGFIQEPMSVYRLHSNGAWTGKKNLDKLNDLKHYVDIYNEFFEYKYDVHFKKLTRGIDDEINRLNKIQEFEEMSSIKVTAISNTWIIKAKKTLRPFVQTMKRLSQFFGS